MLSINTDINSIKIRNYLSDVTDRLNNAAKRLSTGQKLNSAKDDAAGLYISSGLTPRISALTIGINAAQTGKNISDIAQGAITNMQNAFLRIRDLAVQASSDYYTTESRTAMQNEVNSLIDQITMTKEGCNFNGVNLLASTSSSSAAATSLTQLTIDDFDNVQTVTVRGTEIQSGEIDGTTYYLVENADQLKLACGGQSGEKFVLLSDIDLNGVTWQRYTNNSTLDGNGHVIRNGNFDYPGGALVSYNGGIILNLGLENCSACGGHFYTGIMCYINLNSGQIKNCYIKNSVMEVSSSAGFFGMNNNGTINNCYIANSQLNLIEGASNVGIYNGEMYADYHTLNTYAFNVSTNSDINYVNYLDSTIGFENNYQNHKESDPYATYKDTEWFASQEAAEALGDAFEYIEGNDHPTLKWENPVEPSSSALRIQTGFDATTNSYLELDLGFDLGTITVDLSSATSAANSITTIDSYLNLLNDKQSIIGKDYNRLESAAQSNTLEIENMAGAKSIIVDADTAKENSEYIKTQILQNAATSLLAQTVNINSQIVLGLLTSL